MAKPRSAWHLVVFFIVGAACTDGGRTECASRGRMSLLTAVRVDASCKKISPRGVLLYEASRYLVERRNNRTNGDGFELELDVVDTCGGTTGPLKAVMKALVRADVDCLQPPHYLGMIGPDDSTTHVELVQRITSVLMVPQVVVGEASRGPYLHQLSKDDGSQVVQAILKVLEALRWKSFVLVTNGESDSDVWNVAKKLTAKAIAKKLCVVLHNRGGDFTRHIVHVGKPAASFFTGPVNATVLVVSEENLKEYLNRITSTNAILLLENTRNDLDGLKEKIERSGLWTGENRGAAVKRDPEGLTEIRWLEDAIDIYAEVLNAMCGKGKQCANHTVSPVEWNSEITTITASRSTTRILDLFAKDKAADDLKDVGRVIVCKSDAKIKWRRHDKENAESADADFVPEMIRKIKSRRKETRSGCATSTEEEEEEEEEEDDDDDDEDEDEDEVARVIVSEINEREWWTTVATVSGAGVAMFAVGILAVYVICSNIRGPRSRKGNSSSNRGSFSRDASLRRIDSERETSIRDQRHDRKTVQRRDSNRSIGSNVSDRTV